jgi:hypothetical protein
MSHTPRNVGSRCYRQAFRIACSGERCSLAETGSVIICHVRLTSSLPHLRTQREYSHQSVSHCHPSVSSTRDGRSQAILLQSTSNTIRRSPLLPRQEFVLSINPWHPLTSHPHFHRNGTVASHACGSAASPQTTRFGFWPAASSTSSRSVLMSASKSVQLRPRITSRSSGSGNRSIHGRCRIRLCSAVGCSECGRWADGSAGPVLLNGESASWMHSDPGVMSSSKAFCISAWITLSCTTMCSAAGRGA